ncbi:EF-P 5-aminopentanol modification-associated protein YfmF [Guptibacillus algicola]|uniref:EF-P 5-aminopentanol modification-associated protein YfmF n=1 Tax=Guptibacillus algicola TaxID=225844 RepID=UPI001CD818EE|nr:pitrilysin family protein [Alkalihalobacillus algicola]MCA0988104.1 insulinase family protein [Alkalihalobacillus algicola]
MIPHEKSSCGGLTLHKIQTEKYKTTTVVMQFKSRLSEETVTKRALLPYVLQSGTENYPSSKALRTELEKLYGATLGVDLAKKGDFHIMTFRMDFANEKFLSEDKPLLKKALGLFADVVMNPKKVDGAFDSSIVDKEKRTLKQRIQSIYDDKMRYSNMRLTQEMFPNEPFGLHVYGIKEQIDQIDANNLYEYYEKVCNEDEIDLYFVGDLDEISIKDLVTDLFPLKERTEASSAITEKAPLEVKEREVQEEQEIKQGKLHMGFRSGVSYADDDYYALQVFNGMFGGFSHSKLFRNVREKESLAYYAASRYESHKGLIIVMSGIEFKNYNKTVDIIKEQLTAMQNGDFNDEEMNQTKTMIRNQLLETVDDAKGMVELLYHGVVSQKLRSLEEWLDGIDAVTTEDVKRVADQVKLDTVYFLKGEGAE